MKQYITFAKSIDTIPILKMINSGENTVEFLYSLELKDKLSTYIEKNSKKNLLFMEFPVGTKGDAPYYVKRFKKPTYELCYYDNQYGVLRVTFISSED